MPYLTFPTVNCLRMPDRPGDEPIVLVTLERVLAGVVEAGYGHVSVDSFTADGYNHDRLAVLLSDYGLKCSDVGVLRIGEPAATIAAARTLADRAQAVGAKICVTAVDTDPTADGTRELLAHCADLLSEVGVRLALEFLPYTGLATLAQAREHARRTEITHYTRRCVQGLAVSRSGRSSVSRETPARNALPSGQPGPSTARTPAHIRTHCTKLPQSRNRVRLMGHCGGEQSEARGTSLTDQRERVAKLRSS